MTKLETQEINGLTLFKVPYKIDQYISGTELCRRAGYKNPRKTAEQIYSKNKKHFPESDQDVQEMVFPNGEKYRTIARSIVLPGRTVKGEKLIRIYNKPAAYFFVSLMRTQIAKNMTQVLMDTFSILEKRLIAKNTLEWKQVREQGKFGRRKMTDAVQRFIEYAKDQGSQNSKRYYGNFTKAAYIAMGFKGKVPKNFRDNRTDYELAVLNLLEIATDEELYALMDKEIPYSEIFQEVKKILTNRAMAVINNQHGTSSLPSSS